MSDFKNPKHAKFVAEYLKSGNATQAATAAGFSSKNAAQSGHSLLRREDIRAAVSAGQREVVKEGLYETKAAVREIDIQIEDARGVNQFSAVAKFLELKLKLHGLLIDKHEVKQLGFQVVIDGIEDDEPIDVTPEEEPTEDDLLR